MQVKKVVFPLLALIICGILGLLYGRYRTQMQASQPHGDMQAGIGFPRPASLKEVYAHADVIVLGTVTTMLRQGTFAGYAPTGNAIMDTDDVIEQGEVAFADYTIMAERVLKTDAHVAKEGTIILRMPGVWQAGMDDPRTLYPMSKPGDHHLFFLTRNPDGTYGLYYAAWSRLNLDGTSITASDGRRSTVPFLAQFKGPDLIRQLEQMRDHAVDR